MSEADSAIGARLNAQLLAAGLEPVDAATAVRFGSYVSLILRWNARVNLTAIRDEEGILSRHVVESIEVARALPDGISTLLDFGSGAGVPGIPIALCRPEIAVTLAESQGKKAGFLREAVRVLGLRAAVHGERAELLRDRFGCVTMRAVDRMAEAVVVAAGLVEPGGWLAVMTTEAGAELVRAAAGREFSWSHPLSLAGGEQRVLAMGQRISSGA